MAYTVPNMTLIPQAQTMSCWYASAQMLIRWRRDKDQASSGSAIDPAEDAEARKLRDDNTGIGNPAIIAFAKRLGLVAVPPMSPSPTAIESWLTAYGPLWVNGLRHITVIAGIQGNDDVLVYDPWPVNVGKVEWRKLSQWYTGSSSSGRDRGGGVETVFLHCPGR